VMPEGLAGTREITRFLAQELSSDTFVNIMGQYSPAAQVVRKPDLYSEIGRRISHEEYLEAFEIAVEEGLHRFDHRPYL
ncbi:MAG: radical SAM protein, partial [Thermoanaerobaculia bacterium]